MTYQVYADLILLQNLVADFLLLSALKNCLRLPERHFGRTAGSILGAVYALGILLFPFPLGYAAQLLAGGLMSMLMVVATFSVRNLSEVLEASIGLYIVSMLAAGCMELAGPFGKTANFLFWLFAVGGSFCIPSAVWRFGMRRFVKMEHCYEAVIFNRGETASVQAILDTGNHLRMPLSGRPVQVMDARAASKLFQWEKGVQYIPFRSIGKGDGVIPVYQAEWMKIIRPEGVKIIEKPWIAVSEEPVSQKNRYQMLLNEQYWL